MFIHCSLVLSHNEDFTLNSGLLEVFSLEDAPHVASHDSDWSHWLDIELGMWSTIPIPIFNKLCYFLSLNVLENKVHFVLKCPLHNLIKDRFLTLFLNVVLGGLRSSFFQLHHRVYISLYLMEATNALCYTRERAFLSPPWCTLVPKTFWLPGLLNSIPFHFILNIYVTYIRNK